MTSSVFTRPSALLPLAMSFAALGTVIGYIAIYGVSREADEGTAAHIFQILVAGQLPIIAFFAFRWLQRAPRQALVVLAVQSTAIVAALAPVWYYGL